MNKVKISAIVTVCLLIVFGGVMAYFVVIDGDEETTDDNIPDSFDDGGDSILSNPPEGITEHSNGTISISEDTIVENHREIVQESSIESELYKDRELVESIQKDNSMRILLTEYRTSENIESFSADDTYTIQKSERDGVNTYQAENRIIDEEKYIKSSRIDLLLTEMDVDTFGDAESSSNTHIKLHTDEESDRLKNAFGLTDIESVNANMEITEDGLVEEFDIEAIGEENSALTVKRESFEIEEQSDYRVSTPSWVTEAEESSTLINGTYDTTQGWILLEHEGLATIPEGATLKIRDLDGNVQEISVPESVSENDLIGLGLNEDETWEITINEEPSSDTISGDDGYTVIAEGESGEEYFQIRL